MTKEEIQKLEKEYWEVMPDWMKKAYYNESSINFIIQELLMLGIPANELISRVAQALLAAYKTAVQVTVDLEHLRPLIVTK